MRAYRLTPHNRILPDCPRQHYIHRLAKQTIEAWRAGHLHLEAALAHMIRQEKYPPTSAEQEAVRAHVETLLRDTAERFNEEMQVALRIAGPRRQAFAFAFSVSAHACQLYHGRAPSLYNLLLQYVREVAQRQLAPEALSALLAGPRYPQRRRNLERRQARQARERQGTLALPR